MLGADRHPRQRLAAGGADGGDDRGGGGDRGRLADAAEAVGGVGVAQLEDVEADRGHVEHGRDQVVGERRVADLAAGDLADPHGTHKVCLDVIFESLRRLKEAGDEWLKDCWVWLYKGAWQEWDISEIEMAIPMSPDQVRQKRYGIFIHQSQKDMVPFQGSDTREFWQRAEDRNSNTANLFAQLGLTKYAAIEAFVRHYY